MHDQQGGKRATAGGRKHEESGLGLRVVGGVADHSARLAAETNARRRLHVAAVCSGGLGVVRRLGLDILVVRLDAAKEGLRIVQRVGELGCFPKKARE